MEAENVFNSPITEQEHRTLQEEKKKEYDLKNPKPKKVKDPANDKNLSFEQRLNLKGTVS
jgi:hypothetical protein